MGVDLLLLYSKALCGGAVGARHLQPPNPGRILITSCLRSEIFHDLALLLWPSVGSIPALLQDNFSLDKASMIAHQWRKAQELLVSHLSLQFLKQRKNICQ
ncbi:hypothetical protein Bca52824_033282 [Brassica carinata]|uniref:Uncharacterized protein n=1 Tax=Brassica carinata TaxID=52824 RepID=A0A8X7SDX8_BRACI|nr:hypothetical protein Bca52824_033282 [Brassica carinata]